MVMGSCPVYAWFEMGEERPCPCPCSCVRTVAQALAAATYVEHQEKFGVQLDHYAHLTQALYQVRGSEGEGERPGPKTGVCLTANGRSSDQLVYLSGSPRPCLFPCLTQPNPSEHEFTNFTWESKIPVLPGEDETTCESRTRHVKFQDGYNRNVYTGSRPSMLHFRCAASEPLPCSHLTRTPVCTGRHLKLWPKLSLSGP